MKTPVAVTWAAMLAVSYGVVVPAVVTLLRQSLVAARQIEAYTAGIVEHAEGIERNTAQAAALKQTRVIAPGLLTAAESLDRHTSAIAVALGKPGGDGTDAGMSSIPGQEAQ